MPTQVSLRKNYALANLTGKEKAEVLASGMAVSWTSNEIFSWLSSACIYVIFIFREVPPTAGQPPSRLQLQQKEKAWHLEADWGLVWLEQKVERRQRDKQGRTPRSGLIDPSKEFELSSECARSHWKFLSREVAWSNLCFRDINLVAAWRMDCRNKGQQGD